MICMMFDHMCRINTEKQDMGKTCFYLSMFLFMCYSEIKGLLSGKIGHVALLMVLLTYGLLAVSLMLAPNMRIGKKKLVRLVFVIGFLLLYFIFTYLFHPEYSKVLFGPFKITEYILFPMSAFWALFFFAHEADNKILLKVLFLISVTRWFLLVYEAREVMLTGLWKLEEPTLSGSLIKVLHTYNINWAYRLFFADNVFLVMYYRSRNKWLLIPITVGQSLILLYGSRGAFFMFFLFWIICHIFCNRDRKYGKRTIWLMILGIIIVGLFASGEALRFLRDYIPNTGITSRTLKMFLNGEIMSDTGRNRIYGKAWEMLKDIHVFGYGIYGDRYHILDIGQVAINGYGYVHNVFLEILITYGLFGIAILCIGIKKLIKEIILGKDFDLKCIYLICLGCSMNLLFSSSYWYQYYFWAMIGLMIRTTGTRNQSRHFIKVANVVSF